MDTMMLVILLGVGFAVILVLQALRNGRRADAEEKVLKGYFLLGLSGLMAKIAMADGTVTDDETDLARKFFGQMSLSDAERALCIGNFVTSRRDGLTARDHSKRFLAYANPAACEFLYDMLWRIANADGRLDAKEDVLLAEIASFLGLGGEVYERCKRGERSRYDKGALRAAGVPETIVSMSD